MFALADTPLPALKSAGASSCGRTPPPSVDTILAAMCGSNSPPLSPLGPMPAVRACPPPMTVEALKARWKLRLAPATGAATTTTTTKKQPTTNSTSERSNTSNADSDVTTRATNCKRPNHTPIDKPVCEICFDHIHLQAKFNASLTAIVHASCAAKRSKRMR